MIARLVLRDRAVLAAAALWPGAAIVGYMASDVVGKVARQGPIDPLPGPLAFGFAAMWAVMASVNYLSGGGREVASRFHLALPIPGRDLWVARMITLYAPFPGAVVVGFGTFLLLASPATRPGAATAAANALAVALFVPALYHSARVGYAGSGMPLAAFIPLLALSLGMYGLWGIGSPIPAVLLGVASLALAVSTYLRVPESFECAESEATFRPSLPVAHAIARSVGAVPGVGPTLRMYAALRPLRWLNKDQFTLLVLLGATVNVLLLLRSPLTALVAPVILHVAWLIRTVNGASRLDYLPVNRGRIFRHAALPPFVVLLVVVGVFVAWSDVLTLRMLWASAPVAVAALLYCITWALSLATVVGGMAPPTAGTSAPLLARPVLWGWVGLIGSLAYAKWTATPGLNVVSAVGQRLPLSVIQVWCSAALVLALGYLLTVRAFTRVEIVGLNRGMVT